MAMKTRSSRTAHPTDRVAHVPVSGTGTAVRVADVLTAFLDGPSWIGVSDISRQLGLSKAVVHRILSSLVARDILRVDADTRMYGLGAAAVAIGARALQHQHLLAAAEPTMRRLWEQTQETIGLAALLGLDRVCINQHVSPKEVRSEAQLGRRIPLLPGASGLAMLTFLPQHMQAQIMASEPPEGGQPARTGPGLAGRDSICDLIEKVRTEQVVAVRTGHLSGVGSIASPVFGAGRTVMGAVSMSAPLTRLDELNMWGTWKSAVREAGQEMSARLARLVGDHDGRS
jgi:DNA-binding IclR family transcriptional regulator